MRSCCKEVNLKSLFSGAFLIDQKNIVDLGFYDSYMIYC